jgi:hypothetical protein
VPQNSVNGRLNDVNGKKSKYFKKTGGHRPATRLPKSSGGHIKSAQEDGRYTQYLRAVIHIQMYAIQRFSTESRLVSTLSIKYEYAILIVL